MLMSPRKPFARLLCFELLALIAIPAARGQQSEPPALNPFGSRAEREDQRRDDAVPGFVEMSDGKVHPGQVTLTRDARLKIFDEQQKKHREIPLKAIKRIDCTVQKEWVEEEWRFKENANDEKYFTGRTYPSREYTHKITLQNGQKIEGTLSGIVYVRADPAGEPERYLLHKRDKGEPGTDLKSLVHVRSIQLGAKALEEGKRKAAGPAIQKPSAATRQGRRCAVPRTLTGGEPSEFVINVRPELGRWRRHCILADGAFLMSMSPKAAWAKQYSEEQELLAQRNIRDFIARHAR